MRLFFVILTLIAGGAAAPVAAVDGIALTYGDAQRADVQRVQAAAQWHWDRYLLERGDWRLDGYWELMAAGWINDEPEATNSGLWELGFTPVFRLQRTLGSALSPYAEAGVGAHLLSASSVTAGRRFSTAFQFGTHIGVGVRFGSRHAYEVGYRFQHLSNANIRKPNDGIEFHEIRLGYWF